MNSTSTRIAALSKPSRLAVTSVLLMAIMGGLLALQPARSVTETASAPSSPQAAPSDIDLYRAVMTHLRGGASYYEALGQELRGRGFPTRSPFNWRPPLHLSLLAWVPHPIVGQVLLSLTALFTVAMAWTLALSTGGLGVAVGTLAFLLGAFLLCFVGEFYLFSELWAGVFLVCSAYLLAFKHWRAAVVVGCVAALLREFAVLYLVVAFFGAFIARRRAEAWSWLAAIGVFTLALGLHAFSVRQQIILSDLAAPEGWIQLGGWGFILASARTHALLLIVPAWVTAVYVPLAMLGLLAWPDSRALVLQLTAVGFVSAFLIIGRPENFYWGLLYVPLLAPGIAWAPAALRDLAGLSSGSPALPPR